MEQMKRSDHVAQGNRVAPPYSNVELFAIGKWKREHPKRYYLLIRQALVTLKLRYHEHISVWNNDHHPAGYAGAFQLLDFVIVRPYFVILVRNRKSIKKPTEVSAWEAKQTLLRKRKVPFLILDHIHTSQEYQVMIQRFMMKLNRR